MQTYTLRYWYLHGREEKDYEILDIVAPNEELAKEELRRIRRNILPNISVLAVDGVECEKLKL